MNSPSKRSIGILRSRDGEIYLTPPGVSMRGISRDNRADEIPPVMP